MGRLFFLVMGIVCASCLDPTQITVHVTTSYPCGDTNTGMLVGGPIVLTTGGSFGATQATCSGPNEVGKLVVVPTSTNGDAVYLRVVAGVDGTTPDVCTSQAPPASAHCIEARRILRFVQHQKLELPVELDRSCINIRCGEKETCEHGKCVNAIVTTPSCIADPATCPDAEPPSDSGVSDSGWDSGADSGVPVTARLLAAGFDQACAVRTSDGALVCWGAGKTAVTPLPVMIGPIKYLAVGGQHMCASDGAKVTCWGPSNAQGQLGGAQPVNITTQGTVVGGLVAGEKFSCMLDATKAPRMTRCWGTVLDDPNRPNEKVIYQLGSMVLADPGFEVIAAGARHLCGYVLPSGQNNTLYCWGDNLQKQCNTGNQTATYFLKPNPVVALPTTLLGAGFDHSGAGGPTPADQYNNKTFAWGGNLTLQLTTVPDQIVFGESMVCLREGGKVRCANSINIGLTAVPFPEDAASIAAGRAFVCALSVTGRVYCSGTLPPLLVNAPPTEILLPP